NALAEQNGEQGDGAQVVDNGQGQQEDAQRRGQTAPHHGENGQGEGDVGRQRNGPSLRGAAQRSGDGQIDQARNRHAAQRRQNGQGQLLGIAEFALQDLIFDFKADDQEEERHQAFLDTVGVRRLKPQGAGQTCVNDLATDAST